MSQRKRIQKRYAPGSKVYGFLGGPKAICDCKVKLLTKESSVLFLLPGPGEGGLQNRSRRNYSSIRTTSCKKKTLLLVRV